MSVGEGYLWIKALHLVSVIAWMAGLLYLPRLFVYHAGAESGSDTSETFKTMERRLMIAIMTPAMVASVVLGLWLLYGLEGGVWSSGWLYGKLLCVVGLLVLHVSMERWRRDFAGERNRRPPRFYRLVNEVPTVLMIVIVILAVVKPL